MTSSPSMVMLPALGVSKPPIMRSSVDLPEPDGPSRHTSSPSPTVRLKLSTARTSPEKSFVTPLMSRTAKRNSLCAETARERAAADDAAREQQREEGRDPEDDGEHRSVLDHRLVVDERDHEDGHGANGGRTNQPCALGLVEGVDECQQHGGANGRAGLRQGDRPEDPQRARADVARCLLHAAITALEGGDRDPDHEEQCADELDQQHAPEIEEEIKDEK